jgi:hypothetical protein
MFRINQKAKLFLAVVVFLLLAPLTIYYVVDGVFDLRSRAGDPDVLPEEFKIADLNADNKITIADFSIWLSNFRQFKLNPAAFNAMSDLDKNAAITISDFAIWLDLWRKYKVYNFGGDGGVTPPIIVESPLFGTGTDGSVSVSADTNINTSTISSTRSCADAKSYNVVKFDSDTVVQVNEGVSEACIKTGDEVLVLGLAGTETNVETVGNYETFIVASVAGDKITFATAKTKAFGNKAIVQRVPQYENVSIAAGKSLYPSAWDGTSGGVVFFRATGRVSVEGTIHADGMGYRGGAASLNNGQNSKPGEGAIPSSGTNGQGGAIGQNGFAGTFSGGGGAGTSMKTGGVASTLLGSTGGGGGGGASSGSGNDFGGFAGGGGGGGNGTGGIGGKSAEYGTSTVGATGTDMAGAGGKAARGSKTVTATGSTVYKKQAGGGGGGGATIGTANLLKLTFGGGGGGGGCGTGVEKQNRQGTSGTNGGGIIYIAANEITVTGVISARGLDPVVPSYRAGGQGGGGAGGSIKLIGNILNLGTNKILATGGANTTTGGTGGMGRIGIQYMSTFTGSTNPVSANSKI